MLQWCIQKMGSLRRGRDIAHIIGTSHQDVNIAVESEVKILVETAACSARAVSGLCQGR